MTTSTSSVLRLQSDFVAVKVSFEPWLPGSKRPTRSAKRAMAAAANVSEDSHTSSLKKYNHKIVSIRKANAVRTAIKDYVEKTTSYGPHTSMCFLPVAELPAFEAQMAAYKAEVAKAAAEVHASRQAIIDDAQQRLNGEFDAADYPADFASLFSVTWTYPNLQVDDRLPPAIKDAQQQQIATQLDLDAHYVEMALLEEFQDMVAHLEEVLRPAADGKRKKFHASTLEKVIAFHQRANRLSVLRTPYLFQEVEKAHHLTLSVSAAEIRESVDVAIALADMLRDLNILKQGGTPSPIPVPGSQTIIPGTPEQMAQAALVC